MSYHLAPPLFLRFYPRWKEYERWQARLLDYYVPEGQVLEEWAELICLASQPGAALEQLHIFVLAHILRRPIVVYGVKCVKSFRGEDLGYARFEGLCNFVWGPFVVCLLRVDFVLGDCVLQ